MGDFYQGLPFSRIVLSDDKNGCLSIILIEFSKNNFNSSYFHDYNLHMPPRIAGSAIKRQAEFFFGRLAARISLSDICAADCDVPIGPTRQAVWPPGVVGSISHCDTLAAATTAYALSYNGIGIDIERVVSDEERASLLTTVVNLSEQELLFFYENLLPKNVLLTLIFSAKESLYKATASHVGFFFDFSAASFVELDIMCNKVRLLINQDLSTNFCKGTACDIHFSALENNTVLTTFTW